MKVSHTRHITCCIQYNYGIMFLDVGWHSYLPIYVKMFHWVPMVLSGLPLTTTSKHQNISFLLFLLSFFKTDWFSFSLSLSLLMYVHTYIYRKGASSYSWLDLHHPCIYTYICMVVLCCKLASTLETYRQFHKKWKKWNMDIWHWCWDSTPMHAQFYFDILIYFDCIWPHLL
mgnify:CR=1 FL=1